MRSSNLVFPTDEELREGLIKAVGQERWQSEMDDLVPLLNAYLRGYMAAPPNLASKSPTKGQRLAQTCRDLVEQLQSMDESELGGLIVRLAPSLTEQPQSLEAIDAWLNGGYPALQGFWNTAKRLGELGEGAKRKNERELGFATDVGALLLGKGVRPTKTDTGAFCCILYFLFSTAGKDYADVRDVASSAVDLLMQQPTLLPLFKTAKPVAKKRRT